MSLITITHVIGSAGLEIAQRVAAGLNLEFYDDSRLRDEARRIEASLMEMDLRHAGLKVEMPEKGVVHISGVLYKHEDRGRIPTVIGGIAGVEKVQMDVTLMPVGYE